jgi:hypothetical protein
LEFSRAEICIGLEKESDDGALWGCGILCFISRKILGFMEDRKWLKSYSLLSCGKVFYRETSLSKFQVLHHGTWRWCMLQYQTWNYKARVHFIVKEAE